MAAPERFAVNLRLKTNALMQWTNFNFNSMCVFNGTLLGANEDGIFSLLDADDDDGTDIDSFFELPTTDMGISDTKNIVFGYFSGEVSGDLKLKCQVDEGQERTFLVPSKKTGQKQHRMQRIDGRNDLRGVFWRARVENTKGCDFSVDAIELLMKFYGNNR